SLFFSPLLFVPDTSSEKVIGDLPETTYVAHIIKSPGHGGLSASPHLKTFEAHQRGKRRPRAGKYKPGGFYHNHRFHIDDFLSDKGDFSIRPLRNGSVEPDEHRVETRIGAKCFQARIDAHKGKTNSMLALRNTQPPE